MNLFRFSKDMFGREMLIGVNWDLLWLPVAAAACVISLHVLVGVIRRRN